MSTKIDPGQCSKALGAALEKHRIDRGLSLRQLDAATGISYARIRRALNGERALTVDDFVDVCRALGLRASTVLREVEAELHTPALPPEWELAALDVDPRTLDGGLDPARGEEPQ